MKVLRTTTCGRHGHPEFRISYDPAMVVVADLSQMSRAEVERIWLPFVPWLLIGCALLPERWRRWGLGLQVVVALVVQHLLATGW